MQQPSEGPWQRLPEFCEKLGEELRGRVPRRMWSKVDVSGFGNSIAAEALVNQQKFRGETDAELYRWLQKLAHRKLLEKYRYWLDAQMRDIRRERSPNTDDDSTVPCPDAAVSLLTPSAIAVQEEHGQFVNRALAALDTQHTEVLMMHYEFGLSRRELAELLDISPGQVAHRMRTGLTKLREQLARLAPDLTEP